MGREIKRVALDFDYPINKMIWKGYHNPYHGLKCGCGGSGNSPEYERLKDEWYGYNKPLYENWGHNLTQNDVDILWKENRLRDFEKHPTAEQVNEWSRHGMGHGSLNGWLCIEARMKRENLGTTECGICHGSGELWPNKKYEKMAEEWARIEPPSGDGYQLWGTSNEGTPMSPVFSEPEGLAHWLADNRASACGSDTATYGQWLTFIKGPGWAPSMVGLAGRLEPGVIAAGKIKQ